MNISICAWCQKQFPVVNAAVRKAELEKSAIFSHGICRRHAVEAGMSPEMITKIETKAGKSMPDLAEHPELVQAYSQGNFTPQLKERLQKLANIKS